MIIGISGRKGSGKDTVGKILQYLVATKKYNTGDNVSFEDFCTWRDKEIANLSGWEIRKFAEKLKDIVCIILGCTREDLENEEFKSKKLGEEWRVWYYTHYKYPTKNGRISSLFPSKEWAEKSKNDNKQLYEYFGEGVILESMLLTPRLILQLLGTEGMRDLIHPNIHINMLMREYQQEKIEEFINRETEAILIEGTTRYSTGQQSHVPKEFWDKEIDSSKFVWTEKLTDYGLPNWVITDVRWPCGNEGKAIEDRGGFIIKIESDERIGKSTDTHDSEASVDNCPTKYRIFNNKSIDALIEQVKNILILEKIL